MSSTEKLKGILGHGKQNAIRRHELAEKMDMIDRTMREAIFEARVRDGVPICNDQDGMGYYIPETPEEYRAQYEQTKSRGRAILAQLKVLRAGMGITGQITLEELLTEEE